MSCVQHFRILRWTAIIGGTQNVSVCHKGFLPFFSNQQYVLPSVIRQIPDIIDDHEPQQYHRAEHKDA